MPRTSSKEDLSQQADFVFQGTVKDVQGATASNVPGADKSIVVTVGRILQAPEPLRDYEGRNVTVQLAGRKKVKPGQEAIFYTSPTSWGEDVVVTSLGHEPVGKANASLRSAAALSDPYETLVNRDMKARFDSSDLVIFGKVKSVSLPPDAGSEKAAPSEHAPLWRDAEIEIQEVLKGRHPGKTVTVRFPSSEDRQWYDSPKFHVGQQGYIMLCKQEVKSRQGATHPDKLTEAYTALSPLDFQPPEVEDRIRRLGGV